MRINLLLSRVKGGSFENDAKQLIEFGYVYAQGDFRDLSQNDSINCGQQVQKFKCTDRSILLKAKQLLIAAGQPVDVEFELDFSGADGAVSQPVIRGIYS